MKVLGPFEITSVGTSVVSDGVVYEGVGVDVDVGLVFVLVKLVFELALAWCQRLYKCQCQDYS